jgi:hypothetical protein
MGSATHAAHALLALLHLPLQPAAGHGVSHPCSPSSACSPASAAAASRAKAGHGVSHPCGPRSACSLASAAAASRATRAQRQPPMPLQPAARAGHQVSHPCQAIQGLPHCTLCIGTCSGVTLRAVNARMRWLSWCCCQCHPALAAHTAAPKELLLHASPAAAACQPTWAR